MILTILTVDVKGFSIVTVVEATPVVPISTGKTRLACVTRFWKRGGIVVASLIDSRAAEREAIGVVPEFPAMMVSEGSRIVTEVAGGG